MKGRIDQALLSLSLRNHVRLISQGPAETRQSNGGMPRAIAGVLRKAHESAPARLLPGDRLTGGTRRSTGLLRQRFFRPTFDSIPVWSRFSQPPTLCDSIRCGSGLDDRCARPLSDLHPANRRLRRWSAATPRKENARFRPFAIRQQHRRSTAFRSSGRSRPAVPREAVQALRATRPDTPGAVNWSM
jgi:hypothetical protein